MLTEVVRSSKKFKNKYKNPFSADSNSTSILQKKENYNMQYLRRMVLVFTCVMLMGGITACGNGDNAANPSGRSASEGQIVDASTGLVETLEAVKEDYDAAMTAGKPVGIGCAMKNAGVGVGIPDTGRVKLQ